MTLNSGTLGSTGQVGIGSLGSSPTSYNPGGIDTTKTAGVLSDMYTQSKDGFQPIKSDQTQLSYDEQVKRDVKTQLDLYKEYVGQKPNINDDPQIIEAQRQRQEIQQRLQAPTAELNAVIAKQNADLLAHRKMVSEGGGTTTGFGGIEAAINYNAAIRALPLQASIAALQGDLKLAQDNLQELTQIKTEQINSQYEYNKSQFNLISGLVTKAEQRRYEELKTANENQRKDALDLENFKEQLALKVIDKAPSGVTGRIMNAPDRVSAMKAAGDYVPQATSAGALSQLPVSIQGKIISAAEKLDSNPITKKFIETADSINIVNGIDANSKNPADHQTIVYAFAKALDPDSAVKEGEYETIRKYAQSTLDKYRKEVTNAIAGTGFLSKNAIENIKTTMNNNFNSRKPLFDNSLKETKRIINNIAGTDIADSIMKDYYGGITNKEVNITPEQQSLRAKYNY
jgi:hypothetical protein